MRILALNPYHGGSHKVFLDGWIAHSRHEFDVLQLPAYKWKWRMRHAAMTFAEHLNSGARISSMTEDLAIGSYGSFPLLKPNDPTWDAIFCTDMLNLAEFRGLCPPAIRKLPTVVYFHENQLTYPSEDAERDLHYGFTNLTTALAASAVWWNSEFHKDTFLGAAAELIGRMPDFQPEFAIDAIRAKSRVRPPGVVPIGVGECKSDNESPLHIVWVSRWEHDKDPETFFAALHELASKDIPFTVSVLGESFANQPECFEIARRELGERVSHWGYLESADSYRRALQSADVVVSTARHEFFGIAVVEAVSASCFPCVPRRLAYPEVLGDEPAYFHDGTVEGLVECLTSFADSHRLREIRATRLERSDGITQRYAWSLSSTVFDELIAKASGAA